jgi:Transposase, Mutator family
MTHYQLTLDSAALQRLFGENEQLAHLLEEVLNQVLEAQVSEHLQAEPYERTEDRRGYRNGYKPRQLTTRVGTLHLRVPQVRDGSFSPELFACYQRSEQALVCTLMEMVVNGVSTRKVAQITEKLCGKAFSKSTVSELCQGLDPLVSAWNERSFAEQRYPFVLVDALVLKIREGPSLAATAPARRSRRQYLCRARLARGPAASGNGRHLAAPGCAPLCPSASPHSASEGPPAGRPSAGGPSDAECGVQHGMDSPDSRPLV